MSKPAIPALLVLALAVALLVWAYGHREVRATVTIDQDEVVIQPAGGTSGTSGEPITYD